MVNLTHWYRYMNQDVKLDMVGFKRYLKRAYEKAKEFMHKVHMLKVGPNSQKLHEYGYGETWGERIYG